MPETERPKTKLPDGSPNPEYHRWYRAHRAPSKTAAARKAGKKLGKVAKKEKPAEAAVAVMEEPEPVEEVAAEVSGELDSSESHKLASVGSIPTPATFLTLKCIKAAKNPKFVFCDLGGVKVPVRCKRGLSKKMPGKRIKVSVDNSGTTPIYTHIR